MYKPLPLHSYVDILQASKVPSPVPWPVETRSHVNVKQTIHSHGLSARAFTRLPLEVLREIFALYVDLSPVVYRGGPLRPGIYNNMSQQLNLLPLSQVCAYWRAVMCSIPEFWSSICIVGPVHDQAYAIDTWLCRARSRPTDILFIQTDPRYAPHELEEATDQILLALIRHSSYWERLRLEFRYSEYQSSLATINPRALQRLKALHLEFPPWATPRPEFHHLWANLYQAPSLWRVSWETTNIPPLPHLSRWQQLTWVNCGRNISQNDLWSILKVASSLIKLRVRGIFVDWDDPFNDPPEFTDLTHRSLQILDLEFKSSPAEIYRCLRVPSLTSLRVAQNSVEYDGNHVVAIEALSHFLRSLTNVSKLESLTIIDPTVAEPGLVQVLHVEELRHLTYLGLDYVTENMFSSLNFPSSAYGATLPRLRKLQIFNSYRSPFGFPEGVVDKNRIYSAAMGFLKFRPKDVAVCLDPCHIVLTSDT